MLTFGLVLSDAHGSGGTGFGVGAKPVPVSAADTEPELFEPTLSVLEKVPTAAGVNATSTKHVAPLAIVVGQRPASEPPWTANCVLSVATLLISVGRSPVFVTVKRNGSLVARRVVPPTCTRPKSCDG